jgi:RNA polymerase-binding transcription factor DksA
MADKTRYSDAELKEFKELITEKLETARAELREYQDQIQKKNTGDSDSDYKFRGLEDSSVLVEREYLSQMAGRQAQFIDHLEKALIRIDNKTYGICRETGKLISKERLKIVPHATLSIEAKNAQRKK